MQYAIIMTPASHAAVDVAAEELNRAAGMGYVVIDVAVAGGNIVYTLEKRPPRENGNQPRRRR